MPPPGWQVVRKPIGNHVHAMATAYSFRVLPSIRPKVLSSLRIVTGCDHGGAVPQPPTWAAAVACWDNKGSPLLSHHEGDCHFALVAEADGPFVEPKLGRALGSPLAQDDQRLAARVGHHFHVP